MTGQALPGPFYYNKLFLLGARLTTSYEEHNQNVHVDVFGFPGDWFIRPRRNERVSKAPSCEHTNNTTKWSLYTYAQLMTDHVADLYCQVECSGTKNIMHDCGEPIRMQLIPLNSGDPNQDETTFIWRCNVTRHLAKKDLVQEAAASKHSHAAIRVQLYVKEKNDSIDTMQDVTQIDIPLHTGVAGFAGPQIRSSQQNYFSPPPQQGRPLQVGLCMSMYGRKALQYLPDFVQHHKNVGIDQIMIGV